MSAPVRVALADDDAEVRAGLAAILQADPQITVTVEAADGRELLEALSHRLLDVVLVDVRMPRLDGLAVLPEIRRVRPDLPVAVLTTFGDDEYVTSALLRGADGFLLKTDPPADLARHVLALASGGTVLSPRIARRLVDDGIVGRLRERAAARERTARLAPRDRDLLALLSGGESNAAIAGRLGLTEGTVKQYLRRIYAELGVENRVEAAVLGHVADLPGDQARSGRSTS